MRVVPAIPEIKPVTPVNELDVMDRLPERMSCDIAIVGYGPVGMMQAALLAQQGLKVVVVERFPSRYALGRAGHFDGETFRTFQQLGIAQDMELLVRPMLQWQLTTAEMEVLATIKLGESGSGWKDSYLSYQPEFEVVFDAKVRELGVRVFMGLNAVAIEQDADRVRLTVQGSDDSIGVPVPDKHKGKTCVIDAAIVLGADGARSFVRDTLGIERRDLGFKANAQLVIDFEHADPDRDLPSLPEVFQILDVNRPRLAGRWSGGRYSRWEFHLLEGESREEFSTEEICWKFLAHWGVFPGDGRVARHTVYTFESKIAEQWRVGRVLLIGDAAHTMPPFRGQGLCSGIRDAINLSWKLPAVIAGEAPIEFLESYQSERVPHAEETTELSMAFGKMALMMDPEEARLRDEMFRSGPAPVAPPLPRLGEGIVQAKDAPSAHPSDGRPSFQARVARGRQVDRLDEFLDLGWSIVSRHPISPALFNDRQRALLESLKMQTAHVSRGATAQYVDIDGEYDMLYRMTGRKAFLVRPDHYVFGSVETMEELPGLVDELGVALAGFGWPGAELAKREAGEASVAAGL